MAASSGAFGAYDLGSTTVYAAQADARFCYCLHVPSGYPKSSPATELLVVVHGSPRTFMDFRAMFVDFSERNNVVVLSPLFPVGVAGDGNPDGYKYVEEKGLRYDELLLGIVSEVRARYGLAARRFGMYGFSGGAQFANRFLLLQAEHLWAASIVAPGSVTLLDGTRDWWVGTRDVEGRFGRALDVGALQATAVQLLVGDADLDTHEITHTESGRYWMAEANSAGPTRPERLRALHDSLRASGIATEIQVLPGVGHEPFSSLSIVQGFLERRLAELRR